MHRLTLLEGDRRLAQIALERGVVRAEDLARALSASAAPGDLGRLLVERSILGASELEALLGIVADEVPGYAPPPGPQAGTPPPTRAARVMPPPLPPEEATIASDAPPPPRAAPASRTSLADSPTLGDATLADRTPSEATLLVGPPRPLTPVAPRSAGALTGTFGKYEILGELGKGAMGSVYRAREAMLNRVVALKVLHGSHAASESAVARFQKEAKTAAQLTHPGIVRIHEVGVVGDAHFMSMDLVEGKPLSQVIAEKSLPLPASLRLLQRVAEAVDYAHRRGVIHRDLKPSNVLVDAQGNPFVTDFGLAREVASSTRLTLSGTTLGTPPYMPPEQALGETNRVDQRSDVYSLGAILYEILTGSPPFTGGTPFDIIVRVIGEAPVPPRRHNPDAPVPVETICLKAIEKEPAHRYQTAAAFALDIERVLRGEQIAAKPVSLLTKSARAVARNRLLAAVATGGAVVVALTGSWVYHRRAEMAAKARQGQDERERQEAESLRARHLAAVREAKRRDAERLLDQAAAAHGEAALDLATKAVDTAPDLPEAYLARSRFLETLARYDLALADLSRAIELDPACVPAYLRRAWVLDDFMNRREEADKDYAKVVELCPDSDVGYLARARSNIVGKNYGEAEVDCDKAIQINPKNAMAYATRAFSRWLSDQQKKALDDYRTALSIDPAAVRAYLTQALLSLSGHRPSSALMEMTRGLQTDPDSRIAQLANQGFVAALQENWVVALASINQVVKENPEAYWGRLLRGAAYMNASVYPLALADFNWCIQKDPTLSEAWNLRGYVRYHQGLFALAIPDYDQAIQCEPTDETSWSMRGWCLQRLGRKEEAEKSFDRSLQLAPRSPRVRIERGDFFAQTGEPEKALVEYTKAVELSPRIARGYLKRAGALLSLKREAEARAEFEKATALDPDDPVAWRDRGAACYQAGRCEEAVKAFGEAIRLDPGSADLRNWRGCAYFLWGRYEEAYRDYMDAIQRSAGSSLFHSNAASALALWGKHAQAMEMFDRALALNKSEANAYTWRAVMYAKEGRYALAARDAMRLAELTRNPDRRREAEALMRRSQAFEKPAPLPRIPRAE